MMMVEVLSDNPAVITALLIDLTNGYFGWSDSNDLNFAEKRSSTPPPPSTNLACFFCSQLLSVTKHRVGLSQNQLQTTLYDKCRVLPIVLKSTNPPTEDRNVTATLPPTSTESERSNESSMNSARASIKRSRIENRVEEKRITCAFCERMLENAKNYAVTAKADITSFANTACSKLPKGRYSDHCYHLADKKIAELAKFVDQQVIEALWCAELNQC
ncbi:unnamed protein product [Nippostrongylus brasiliensis]|uniref:Saposin B-type domain-containing protein n=1 Tax=Nippostrongylus brasiliensis TaxID=27835 RepID=A0A158QZU4_NIPBR|nr:unnamed protein product [Nippostrongylus brasiliensis]